MTDRQLQGAQRSGGTWVWLGSLGFFALLGLVIAVFAIVSLVAGPSKHEQLVERGILMRGESALAVADLSPQGDMSEGCLITPARAMSWKGDEVDTSVPLAGSSITVQRTEVTIHGHGQSVVCRFRNADLAEDFAEDVARESLRTRPGS